MDSAFTVVLTSRLQECELQRHTVLLFLSTMGNLVYRLGCPGVPVSKPQVLRKILPRVFTLFCTNLILVALFKWNLCRRGGATHGYDNRLPTDLRAPHGGCFTV